MGQPAHHQPVTRKQKKVNTFQGGGAKKKALPPNCCALRTKKKRDGRCTFNGSWSATESDYLDFGACLSTLERQVKNATAVGAAGRAGHRQRPSTTSQVFHFNLVSSVSAEMISCWQEQKKWAVPVYADVDTAGADVGNQNASKQSPLVDY